MAGNRYSKASITTRARAETKTPQIWSLTVEQGDSLKLMSDTDPLS